MHKILRGLSHSKLTRLLLALMPFEGHLIHVTILEFHGVKEFHPMKVCCGQELQCKNKQTKWPQSNLFRNILARSLVQVSSGEYAQFRYHVYTK